MTSIFPDGRFRRIWGGLDRVKLLSPLFGHVNLGAPGELEKRLREGCHLPPEPYLHGPRVSGSHLFTDTGPTDVLIRSHATSEGLACESWLDALAADTSCAHTRLVTRVRVPWVLSATLCTAFTPLGLSPPTPRRPPSVVGETANAAFQFDLKLAETTKFIFLVT